MNSTLSRLSRRQKTTLTHNVKRLAYARSFHFIQRKFFSHLINHLIEIRKKRSPPARASGLAAVERLRLVLVRFQPPYQETLRTPYFFHCTIVTPAITITIPINCSTFTTSPNNTQANNAVHNGDEFRIAPISTAVNTRSEWL